MFFPENGEFIDELVGTEWSIADESIAEITEVILDGKAVNVRGLKEGTTTLTATFKGKSTSMEITTKKVAKLESLSFPQETYTKKVGEKFIFFRIHIRRMHISEVTGIILPPVIRKWHG